jgi:hypothetical protein
MRAWTEGSVANVFAPGPPPGRIRMSVVGDEGRVEVSGRMRTLRVQLIRAIELRTAG